MKIKISRNRTFALEVKESTPVSAIQKAFSEKVKTDKYHFLKTVNMDEVFRQIDRLGDFVKRFEVMLHIGIGGSGLAPLVLNNMFSSTKDKRLIVVENLDERWLNEILHSIDPKKTCVHVVSKSGNTSETISNFLTVYKWMREKLSPNETLERVVITTNPATGYLNEIVRRNSIKRLTIPGELTGRFSAVSPVTLFPALFIGLNIPLILRGAKQLMEEFKSMDNHPVSLMAGEIFKLYEEGKNVIVFMPYSERLQALSRWFVQLWAESLGKNQKGQTPVPAKGVTDQHTILQLIMDGPKDKVVMLLKLESEEEGLIIEERDGIKPPDYLTDVTLTELKEAEYYGTVQSMKKNGIPVLEIYLEDINEEMAGKLFIFFETLVSLVGEAMGIDPFNQPAVEEGKRLAKHYLKEKRANKINFP